MYVGPETKTAIETAPEPIEKIEKDVWVKPVIEDLNTQIEGGPISGVSDGNTFHS